MPGAVSSFEHGARYRSALSGMPSRSRTSSIGRSASRAATYPCSRTSRRSCLYAGVVNGSTRSKCSGTTSRGVALDGLPAVDRELAHELAERRHRPELLLRLPLPVREPEVELEGVVAIGILVAEIVVVAVVPGEPAACAGEQRRVQDLPVVGGGVLLGGEVGADAELLQDHRLAEAPGELARERGRQRQPRHVVLHRIGVRAEEVDQRCERAQRVPVVVAGGLDAPGAVAERDRLGRARPRGPPGRRAAPTR